MPANKVRIEVGFVSIAARMEKATDDEDGDLRTVCVGTSDAPHEAARVKQHVDCPSCGKSASSHYGFPHRAVEVGDKLSVVTTEQIAKAAGAPIKSMSLKFHSREKFYAATLASDSVQNLTPDKGGEKGYTALVEVLRRHPELVAVTVYAPRSKNALWVLEVVENRLVASKRCWPEVVRPAPMVAPAEVSQMEVDMFSQFIESEVTDFDLGEYVDARRSGIKALVDSASSVVPVQAAGSNSDLLAALIASLEAAKPSKPRAVKSTKAAPRKRAPRKTSTPAGKTA